MLLLCGLLVATLFTGAYDDAAFGFSQGAYMVFLIAFLGGMLVLLLATAVPLKHVRLASNMLVLAGSVFIATQLDHDLPTGWRGGRDLVSPCR